MRKMISEFVKKTKTFFNDLNVPDIYTLKATILDQLNTAPYTAQELNDILCVNNIAKTREALSILECENLIHKTEFREKDKRTKEVVVTDLYFSNSFEKKAMDILEKESKDQPDLTQSLGLHLGGDDEFKIMAIMQKLQEDGKITIDDSPNWARTVYRDDGGAINLIKYKIKQTRVAPDNKE